MSLASEFQNVTDSAVTFVHLFFRERKYIICVLGYLCTNQISIRTIYFKKKRVLAHLQFLERKLQTDRRSFLSIVVWNKMIQVCNRFCLFLYSRLPPQQYMTRVWPIKGGLYCWGPPFNLKKYWCTWKNCWVIITFIFIYKYTCYFLTFSNICF